MDKILIVDDNQDNIAALRLLLEVLPENYLILQALSGAEALEMINAEPPSVVLLDIQMAEMDGYEVCAKIRQSEHLPYIPIIFLTANRPDIESKIKGFNLGADDFITKPFEKEILFARLNSVLKIKSLYDRIAQEKNSLEKKVVARTKELSFALEHANQSDQLKTEFLSVLSHEIRTPLNAILGFTDLLLRKQQSKEQSEFLEIVRENGNILLHIFNDLLEISLIKAGQVKIIKEGFSLKKMFRNLISNAVMQAKKYQKDIEILQNYPEAMDPYIFTDRFRLQQVMNNLISNAVKFTSEGFVEIGVRPKGEELLEFYVRDSGIGIPMEKQKIIFEKFRQADMSQTRRYGGTGMGLAICSQLLELLGGEISVDSPPFEEDINQSTRKATTIFRITIPLERPQTPKPGTLNDQSQAPGKKFQKILIADDDTDNLRLLQKILALHNYRCITACNGLETVELFQKNPDTDLVLMDIQMPLMDGFSAVAKIREIETRGKREKPVPIIALSASVMEEDRQRCLKSGFNDFVGKPIMERNLIEALNALS